MPFPRYPDEFGTQWYVGCDIVLRHDPGWIAVAGRTQEAVDAFRHAHPGRWVNEQHR